MINNAKRWTITCGTLAGLGFLVLVFGIVVDDYDYYWMIPIGILVFVTFTICTIIFSKQAKRLDRLFSGNEGIAHWIFDNNTGVEKAKEQLKQRKAKNKIMLLVIGVFFIVITAIFLITGFDDFDEALTFGLIMAGIFVVIACFAVFAPHVQYKRNINSSPDIYIGPYSAWVMGEYTEWKGPLCKITGVTFLKDNKSNTWITVDYLMLQRFGFIPNSCVIPVPEQHYEIGLDAAQKIAEYNNKPLKVENL